MDLIWIVDELLIFIRKLELATRLIIYLGTIA